MSDKYLITPWTLLIWAWAAIEHPDLLPLLLATWVAWAWWTTCRKVNP